MKRNCPNPECKTPKTSSHIIKDGRFKRANDSRIIQRFKCRSCGKRFSSSTGTLEYRQKKRRINPMIRKLLCSNVSMRRTAIIVGVHQTTVKRKLEYLAKKARLKHQRFLKKKYQKEKIIHLQFDDLITKEDSKLKPLSVSIAVDAKSRSIIGAYVSKIPSFGHLSKIAKKKYGPRKCRHKEGLELLFKDLETLSLVDDQALIRSDEHHKYPAMVRKYLPPTCEYQTYKSERGCVTGQGELKKVKFDPLFIINHTCAILRANINRLIRKTWCTTKVPERLKDHLDVFIEYYNTTLLREDPVLLTPLL